MDQTGMLVAAVATLWGIILALSREIRALWLRALNDKDTAISRRDARIADLETEAREAVKAKDAELAELRKLLIAQYGISRQQAGGSQ